MIEIISSYSIPFILFVIGAIMLAPKKNLFDEFLGGIRDGMDTTLKIFPALCTLIIGVGMLSASGFLVFLSDLIAPGAAKIGIPAEILPLLLARPVSGSGAMAVLADLFEKYGADSFVGLLASVITGSSDTLIYVITVYLSSVGIKKTRHAFPAAFLTMLFSVFLSCILTKLFFA